MGNNAFSIIADLIFVFAGLFTVIFAIKSGFFRTLMRFARTFLAIGAAYWFGGMLAPTIASAFPSIGEGYLSVILSYVAVFVLAVVLLTVSTWIIGKLIERVGLVRKLDMILGALIGILFAAVSMFTVASIIRIIPAASEFYDQTFFIKMFGNSSLLEVFKFLDVGNLLK